MSYPGPEAKPGHEGHNRVIAEHPDTIVDHCPTARPYCGLALSAELRVETVSVHEHIELPEVKPLVEQHRRLTVVCPRSPGPLVVAIDRASRYGHLAVKDHEMSASAIAFLEEAVAALPFRIERLLTDRGSCFTADGFETACCEHKIEY